jgi:signal transduction histidine kinase
VLVTDTKGIVVLANPAVFQHLNINQKLKPGLHINKYITDDNLCTLMLNISNSKNYDDDIFSYELKLKNKKYILAKGRPVLNDKKECLGAVLTLMDISAMKVLDHIKSEFVAKVSHELKSPLATIHEQLALVLNDNDNDKDTTENNQYVLYRAKNKTQTLISTIGDLLDLSRIEAGIVFREPEIIDINNLLNNVISFLNIKAKNKGQQLILENNSYLSKVIADPIAIESVLGNLITNAINYTQEGGEIRVSSEMIGKKVKVVIKDNGFGIKKKYHKQIFERFFRVKNEKTRFINGTGLGLSIVKEIVDSFGGDIYVESEPGKGSIFSVLI